MAVFHERGRFRQHLHKCAGREQSHQRLLCYDMVEHAKLHGSSGLCDVRNRGFMHDKSGYRLYETRPTVNIRLSDE